MADTSDSTIDTTIRIGRPPKVDAHGTPTRERLLHAAVEACVEHGYEGATLADIARRADVSTPAVYSHFSGKAALLVEASKHELDKISSGELVEVAGLRELARRWLQPEFARSRILVAEVHCAAIRQAEVAELLAEWQAATAARLQRVAGLTLAQVKLFYILLIGATHVDEVDSLPVSAEETEAEMNALLEGWFADRYA
jgi:AcrR family transcriptional regulator